MRSEKVDLLIISCTSGVFASEYQSELRFPLVFVIITFFVFFRIPGYGKKVQLLNHPKFVRIQYVFYQGALSNPGNPLPNSRILNQPIFFRN